MRERFDAGELKMGTPMDVGNIQVVYNIAVSRGGKWIVGGTRESVLVWNTDDGKEVTEIRGHSRWVNAVDVSSDSARIASGSSDGTVCIWSLPSASDCLAHGNTTMSCTRSNSPPTDASSPL